MSQTNTCAICGGELISGADYCQFCGSPVHSIPANSVAPEQVAVVETQTTEVCPNCGSLIKNGQKFCGQCGHVLSSVTAVGATAAGIGTNPLTQDLPYNSAPVMVPGTGTSVVPAPGVVAGSTNQQAFGASTWQSDASAKFDAFMGATVDLDSVGKNFNPGAINIELASNADWQQAFAFFGKSYENSLASQPQSDAVPLDEMNQSRTASEQEAELQAQNKPQRDFSAQAGTTVFGSLSSQLQTDFAPRVDMIVDQREKAAKKEKVDRLKHKVELGDMDKQTAVKLAEE